MLHPCCEHPRSVRSSRRLPQVGIEPPPSPAGHRALTRPLLDQNSEGARATTVPSWRERDAKDGGGLASARRIKWANTGHCETV